VAGAAIDAAKADTHSVRAVRDTAGA
jgi:hypothetical protein